MKHTRIVRLNARADAPADGLAWFRMTTEIVDGHDSVFYVSGCKLDRYKANPVVLLDHDNSVRSIAGRAEQINVVVENGVASIDLGIRFAETENPDDAGSLAARLHRAGFLRAMSHRFVPIKIRYGSDITPEERARWPELSKWGYIVDEWELEESSFVGVGSNPQALKRAASEGLLFPHDVEVLTAEEPAKPARARAPKRDAVVTVDNGAVLAAVNDLRAAMEDALDAMNAEIQENHRVLMAAVAAGAKAQPNSEQKIETMKALRGLAHVADQIQAAVKAAS